MARPTTRPSTGVQHEPAAAPGDTAGPAEAPKVAGVSTGWRVALFIWATAFIFLIVYELLNTLVRSLARLF